VPQSAQTVCGKSPLRHLQKSEVRKLAEKFGLPQATRKDSQGLCFLGQIDMKEFLKEFADTREGNVLNLKGEVVGTHDGAILYTLGERHGFRVSNKTTDNKPLLLRKAKSLVLLIASFGLLTATGATMGMVFGNQVNFIPRHLSDITTVNIFGGILNITETVFIVVACTVLIIFFLLFFYTNFGRAVRAVEDDREVAELVGISSHKIFLKIFFISGVLAGVGGIYEGLNSGLVPAAGITYILPTIVAVIIGGMWSFRGAILGAIILTILQQLTIFYIGGNWVQAVPFVVLIITLLIRPNGILQK
jgi:branched-chain amino acid transport system permease protein